MIDREEFLLLTDILKELRELNKQIRDMTGVKYPVRGLHVFPVEGEGR